MPTDTVLRRAPRFWEAGHYPFASAPPYEMSAEDNRAAVDAFEPVPLVMGHGGSALDGKLGRVRRIFPAADDYSRLGLEAEIPSWLDAVFRTDDGKPAPMKLSANWDRKSKRLKNVAIVVDPRIAGAALFASDPRPLAERIEEACFAAESYDPGNVPAPGATAPVPAAGPDPNLKASLRVEGDPEALQIIRALAERMGLVCRMEGGGNPPAEEAPMSAATAPLTPTPGAPPRHGERATPPARPSPRERELERKLAETAAKLEQSEARFSALEGRLKAVEDGAAQAAFSRQSAAFDADAAAFAREVSDRVLPYQRAALLADYRRAALDDLKYPEEVHFSAEDGSEKAGTRVEALKARYRALPPHGLGREAMPDRADASFSYDPPRPGAGKADPARVHSILKHTVARDTVNGNGKGA